MDFSEFASSPEPIHIKAGPSPAGWSKYGTILHCLTFYGLKYERGLFNEPSPGRAHGSVMHAGQCHAYARLGAKQGGINLDNHGWVTDPSLILDPHEAMRLEAEEIWKTGRVRVDLPMLNDCLDAYWDHYPAEREGRVLFVEALFSAEIIGPEGRIYPYTARADLGIEVGGKPVIEDFKVHFKVEAKHQKAYAISGQFVGLRWLGGKVYGNRFGGMRLNLIQRTQPFRFERTFVETAPALLARFPQSIVDAGERLRAVKLDGRPPEEYTPVMSETGCYSRYGACPAMEVCKWGHKA
jgi:hypothetical protein